MNRIKQTSNEVNLYFYEINQTELSQELSPLALWNSLFPENPCDEDTYIDLIPPRNSSRRRKGRKKADKGSIPSLGGQGLLPFGESNKQEELSDESVEALIALFNRMAEELPPEQGDNSSSFHPGQGDNSSNSSLSGSQGDNSSKNRDEDYELITDPRFFTFCEEDLAPLTSGKEIGQRSLSEAELAKFAELWKLPLSTVKRAYQKLKKYPECGKSGGIRFGYDYKQGEVVDLILHPISCNSIHCPYCQWRHSRRRLSEIISYFTKALSQGEKLTFITLTIPSTFEIGEAVAKSKKLIERLYQFRFRGKRIRERLKTLFLEELVSYTLSLIEGDKGELSESEREQVSLELLDLFKSFVNKAEELSPEEFAELRQDFTDRLVSSSLSRYFPLSKGRERKIWRQLFFYCDFGYRMQEVPSDAKLGTVLSAVWKFELTYSKEHGYHPHWHGITNFLLPKLYLTAICRYLGFGEISDIRLVDGRKGVVELAKYETKPWELPTDDFVEMLKRESFMDSFRKLRVWNLEAEEEDRELPNVLYFAVPISVCSYTLLGRKSLKSLPLLYRRLRERRAKEKVSQGLREKFSRVKFVASLRDGRLGYAYADVYLGLDGELHSSLSGSATIVSVRDRKEVFEKVSFQDFIKHILDAFNDFLITYTHQTLDDYISSLVERKRQSKETEETEKVSSAHPEAVSSSLSSSTSSSSESELSIFAEAWLHFDSFCKELERFAWISDRKDYPSYEAYLDALFDSCYYEDDLRYMFEFLSFSRKVFSSLLSRLVNQNSKVYRLLSYLLSKIDSELEYIKEVAREGR